MSPVLEERMRAAIGDATTCPHGHPIVEGAREQGVAARRRRARRRGPRPALRERGRGAAALPQGRRARARAWRASSRAPTRTRSSIASADGTPPGLAQRRRDRLGPRRPGAAAARGDPRAARPLQRPLRPLRRACASGRRSTLLASRLRHRRPGSRRGCAPAPGDARDALRRSAPAARWRRRGAGCCSPPSIMKSGPATKATPSPLASASSARGVGALGEVEPEEVAAAGDDELGLGDLLAQRLDQRVARARAARP